MKQQRPPVHHGTSIFIMAAPKRKTGTNDRTGPVLDSRCASLGLLISCETGLRLFGVRFPGYIVFSSSVPLLAFQDFGFQSNKVQLPDDFRSSFSLWLAPSLFRFSPIIDRKTSSSFSQMMICSFRSSSSVYLSPTGHC